MIWAAACTAPQGRCRRLEQQLAERLVRKKIWKERDALLKADHDGVQTAWAEQSLALSKDLDERAFGIRCGCCEFLGFRAKIASI
jgi:hypothetical protein